MNLVNSIKEYFIGSYQEMKKVSWPSKEQTINYSLIVIGMSLAVAIFLSILDYIFSLGLTAIIK